MAKYEPMYWNGIPVYISDLLASDKMIIFPISEEERKLTGITCIVVNNIGALEKEIEKYNSKETE